MKYGTEQTRVQKIRYPVAGVLGNAKFLSDFAGATCGNYNNKLAVVLPFLILNRSTI